MTNKTPEEIQAEIDALQSQLPKVKHKMDYSREPFSYMTVCNKVCGPEFVTEDFEEVTCSECIQAQIRIDEPESPHMKFDAEGNQIKEERYGD
jgi:hypothetical protein